MDGWKEYKDGRKDRWMENRRMDGQKEERLDRRTHKRTEVGWRDRSMGARNKGLKKGCRDGQMEGWKIRRREGRTEG